MSSEFDTMESIDPIISSAYEKLKIKILSYLDAQAEEKIRKAFLFAHTLHASQKRKSGEPYVLHPLAVAEILTDFQMGETTIISALLHDVLEDTQTTLEELESGFGKQVGFIVEGLTKLSKVEFRSRQEKMAENFRKMIVAMSRDIRIIIIKLADRTHNMRTISAHSLEKKQQISEETLEIYAPLAGRLGMYKIKAELEDLCLKALKPSVYFSLVEKVSVKKTEREKIVERLKEQLSDKLNETSIEAEIQGRAKHFYSIYKKMKDKQIEFEDIYDLFAIRFIVKSVNQCYETLGIIHNYYRPVPGRFKDYIAMPKANLYQSLHTTIVARDGELVEIQIRTPEMHAIAEYGIAAHWGYKEKKDSNQISSMDNLEKMNWLRQIVTHQTELTDPDEFLEAVKVDLFDDEVYVFSPKGDVFALHRGATCLDFAFEIHSDLGLRLIGAKVNGRMASIRTKLSSGDVVELMTSNKIRATKDWLNFVITSRARNKIRSWLRSEERTAARQLGQEMFEAQCQQSNVSLDKLHRSGVLQEAHKLIGCGGYEDAMTQIGYGKVDAKLFIDRILHSLPPSKAQELMKEHTIYTSAPISPSPEEKSKPALPSSKSSSSVGQSIRVQGMDNILVRFARCCEPLPGQPVVGFVSRGRGIIVHAANCEWALSNDPTRRVECSWDSDRSEAHEVRLRITTQDKPGILANITKVISLFDINISGLECFTTQQKRGVILLRFAVENINQMKDLHQKIEATEGVISVERLMG